MTKRYSKHRPPKVFCQRCGTEGYAWGSYWHCPPCARLLDNDPGWVRRMQVRVGNRKP
jgi:hypothetical protein